MKKLINRPEMAVEEMLQGLDAAFPNLRRLRGQPVIVRADAHAGQPNVAVISGGGSGHEPAHAGYVGLGMLDAAVCGDVFTSPSSDAVLAAIKAVSGPAGTLLIVKNYTGDRLNFGLAAEIARADGIPVEVLIVGDDVALADVQTAGRRGLAGTVLVHKIAGAAAASGANLAVVAAEGRAAAQAVKTMGVALSSCSLPGSEEPSFVLGPTEVEFGVGIHGEPGAKKRPLEHADVLVDRLLKPILADLHVIAGERVCLLVNNLGGTTNMELLIAARRALLQLRGLGLEVERVYLGTLLSALEMAGISLSIMKLNDPRTARLDAYTDAFAWPNAVRQLDASVKNHVAPEDVENWPSTSSAEMSHPVTAVGIGLKRLMDKAFSAIAEAKDRLNDLDRAVGDGDLGTSLFRGVEAVRSVYSILPWDDPEAAIHEVGLLLQRVLGGTSGPLYAAFMIRFASRLKQLEAEDPSAWSAAFHDGCQAVADLGGAHAGDRTMLDALLPASDAIAHAFREKKSLSGALKAAALAAELGAKGTAAMNPKRGRSSYLGDRALGHVDPGAEAVAIWMAAIAQG